MAWPQNPEMNFSNRLNGKVRKNLLSSAQYCICDVVEGLTIYLVNGLMVNHLLFLFTPKMVADGLQSIKG